MSKDNERSKGGDHDDQSNKEGEDYEADGDLPVPVDSASFHHIEAGYKSLVQKGSVGEILIHTAGKHMKNYCYKQRQNEQTPLEGNSSTEAKPGSPSQTENSSPLSRSHKDNLYWLVVVKRLHGPLLQLAFLGEEDDESSFFWFDLKQFSLFKYGHVASIQGEAKLQPPDSCRGKIIDVGRHSTKDEMVKCLERSDGKDESTSVDLTSNWYDLAAAYIQSKLKPQCQGEKITQNCSQGVDGTAIIDLIRPGFKYELRDNGLNPNRFWMVTVVANKSGILGLSYDSPDLKPSPNLYLWYNNPRLCKCGTVEKEPKYEFYLPEELKAKGYPDQVWKVVRQSFRGNETPGKVPDWVIEPKVMANHNFQEKMLLTIIDPRTRSRFRVGVIEAVLDKQFFIITLLEEPQVKVVRFSDASDIVPISWAIRNGFLEKASLQNMSCSPTSKLAPKGLFLGMQKKFGEFNCGESLEIALDLDKEKFAEARIDDIKGHILTLTAKLAENERQTMLVSMDCIDLYPWGWCSMNNLSLVTESPEVEQMDVDQTEEDRDQGDGKGDIKEKVKDHIEGTQAEELEDPLMSDKSTLSDFLPPSVKHQAKPESHQQLVHVGDAYELSSPLMKPVLSGYWCPPIYFNHLCYSASFMRKPRLEALPKFIGPGPVRLVMREVIARLIGSSFKSGAVLKKLEPGNQRRPGYWLETMKGKSRVLMLQGNVEIPSRVEQVSHYCREVCTKLECCPYLFGPMLVGTECPSACQTRPKQDFLMERQKTRMKGKKGRKRGRKPAEAAEGEDGVSGNPHKLIAEDSSEEGSSHSPSLPATRDTSRDQSPDSVSTWSESSHPLRGKSFKIDSPTSFDKKTRSSKSGKFHQQLKVKPSQSDLEEMEELLEKSLQDKVRPPSPKNLRSRSGTTTTNTPQELQEPSGCDLKPAFDYDSLIITPYCPDPPPVRKINLPSNPLLWTSKDVFEFMNNQEEPEVVKMASLFKTEQIDGTAFLLLNLPSILDHWPQIGMNTAAHISRLVESVKLAFYLQFGHQSDTKTSITMNGVHSEQVTAS